MLRPLDAVPASCAARNVHGRSLEEVQAAAEAWEEPPVLHTMLDFGPMFRAAAGEARAVGGEGEGEWSGEGAQVVGRVAAA